MTLTPLTPAEVGGALGEDEIRAMHVSGEKIGMVLVYRTNDPELLAAQNANEVVVDGPRLEAPAVAPPTHNDTDFPSVIGNLREGQTLTADPVPAAWTGSPTFTYQWVRSGQPVPGATGPTYLLTQADVGASFDVRVTATNAGGNLVVDGNSRGPVLPLAPTNTVAPSITGTPTVGQTLTAANGTWTGSPTFTRQWLANGSNIAGATATTLVLQAAQEGQNITVRVTGTNAGGNAQATSAAVGPVAPAA